PGEAGTEQLREGELPTSESEVVLDQATADALQISLGDTVTVPASFSASGQELPLSVVGIAEPPEGAGFGGSSRVLVSQDSAETVLGPPEARSPRRGWPRSPRAPIPPRSPRRPPPTRSPCAPSRRPRRTPPGTSCRASAPWPWCWPCSW